MAQIVIDLTPAQTKIARTVADKVLRRESGGVAPTEQEMLDWVAARTTDSLGRVMRDEFLRYQMGSFQDSWSG